MSINIIEMDNFIDRTLRIGSKNNGYAKNKLLFPNLSNAISSAIGSATITIAGTSYTSAPNVSFSGGGGSGAAATAVLGFPINEVIVTSAGLYTTAFPTIAAVGTGTGATFLLGMKTLSASLFSGGFGYTVGDVLTPSGTYTSAPTITVDTVSGGTVTGYHISSAGNYSLVPPVNATTTGGTGTGATFNLSSGINAISINTAGQNYLPGAQVSITGGAGSGGAATAILGTIGGVNSLIIINGGDGYNSDTTISFSGGGGVGAAATAVVGGVNAPTYLTLNFSEELPTSDYEVSAISSQPAVCSCSLKTTTGCVIKVAPINGSSIIAGTNDISISYLN